MKASELRSRYLEFFETRDHRILPGSPLVPNDPTLLLTSAGMVQFKDVFWGRAEVSFPRAATCQKCFRTTDIENVGRTAYHNTFFEMLGNFSFGDYFKEGAIRLAWEFLVDELGVPAERLSASVYQDDDEAFAIWRDVVGLPEERIVRLGKEHNWWGPVGDSGPCGPDSEVFFDTGADNACGPDCAGVACECNRYSEMWNLVFMEYDASEDGSLTRLDKKNIDTGMGLERTSAVLQGVPTVFETDLFRPIAEAVEAACPHELTEADRVHRNTIADHVRGILFLLADGVMPGNERQGYVLRRILRRAVRAGEQIGLPPGSLGCFVDPVIDVLGGVYPEIAEARDLAHRLIEREEETFRRTLRDGERRLEKILDELHEAGKTVLPGELLFELYDTYGFPPEMTEEIAAERGMAVDWPGFKRALNEQQTRSKRASVNISSRAGVSATPTVSHKWHRTPTEFLGYEKLVADVEVLGFDRDDSQVVFSATPFYAEGGGQIGDTGTVKNLTRGFEVRILNTTRHEEGAALHHLASADVTFEKGDRCRLTVDADRRRRIQRNHTATHLLHAALREVLGSHVKQAGSLVDDAELRFDFTHFEKLSLEQIAEVEDLGNAAVLRDLKVEPREMPLEEANAAGAIGLFEEEYRGKEKVRVLSICDKDTGECISKELCGGTHVARSGEIGLIKIVSEESIASGVRRIRAVTGDAVLRRLRDDEALLARLREAVGDDPLAGVERLKAQLKEAAARSEAASAAAAREHVDRLIEAAESIGDVRLVSGRVDLSTEQLKELADALEETARPAVVLLVGEAGGSGIAVCKRSKDVKAIDAGKVIRTVSGTLDGGGGGGKTFAQGGGPQIDRLDEALEVGLKFVRDALK
jgi:alanyl-tRNA synthetase